MPNTTRPLPTVSYSLPCVGCGYELVGLAEDALCPECGLSIGRSISGDHLLASSKEHRQKLARGVRLAMLGAWAGWVSLTLLSLYALVAHSGDPVATGAMAVPVAIAMAITFLASGVGWRVLTTADPDHIGDGGESWVQRFVLRLYAMFLGYAAPILVLASLALASMSSWGGQGLGSAFVLVLFSLGILPTLALSGAIAAEVSWLARRLLEGNLADSARGLAPTGWVALGLLVVAAQFSWISLAGWWWLLEPFAWGFASVAVLAWAVQYHTLVRALRAALVPVAARP